jgi:threonine dehydrogenase-like Zn-dependent dehydrogenase
MRAAVYHGQRQISVEDVPEPRVQPGTVKVAVDWCGICGTDLHEYLEGPIFVPPADSPHPITGESLPLTMGHEFAGRVSEVGEGVRGFGEGDPVAVEPVINCGQCPECRRGDHHLCRKLGFVGLSGWGGGFSEFVVVPERLAYPLAHSTPNRARWSSRSRWASTPCARPASVPARARSCSAPARSGSPPSTACGPVGPGWWPSRRWPRPARRWRPRLGPAW